MHSIYSKSQIGGGNAVGGIVGLSNNLGTKS